MNKIKSKSFIKQLAMSAVILMFFSHSAFSYSPEMRRAMVSGPWVLFVKPDMQSEGVETDVSVADVEKASDVNKTIPVVGSTKKIQIEKYLPNLQWKITAEKYHGSGDTAQIKITGPNLDQSRWLSTDDSMRSTVKSSVGGVTAKSLYNTPGVDEVVRKFIQPEYIGILTVVPEGKSEPLQFAVKRDFEVELPDSDYKLKVLKYYPHYVIDKKTKTADNQSDRAVNPAIEVQIDGGKGQYRQWIWSRLSSPHMKNKLPVTVEFSEFNFAEKKGNYELLLVSEDKNWLITNDGKNKIVLPAVIGARYPFANDKYGFTISQVIENSILKDDWFNKSNVQANPSLIVKVIDGDKSDRLTLELGKAQQASSEVGGAVVVFKKKMDVVLPH
ncbi:MAG: hypothetical protein K9M75_03250 [Phycisphaerae bacterium]|nr:hypothetical protein [Phycisphaerae bacterium]